jgi:hypothetical protein
MAPRTVDTLLAAYPPGVKALALGARKLVLEALPAVEETLDTSVAVIGYGYGPGYNGLICTLILSKSGVKLGVARGVELPDPRRLLEGSGKIHRYVSFKQPSDLRRPGLNQLLKSAARAWRERHTEVEQCRER